MTARFWNRRSAAAAFATAVVAAVLAHEGHAPLPSKGSRVDSEKGLVTLSAEARAALDVATVEIGGPAPPDTILAYATLTSPWKSHAFAVTRAPGRIVALYAKPGDRVAAGQTLGEIHSQSVETLRLEIQTARNNAELARKVSNGLRESAGAIPERDAVAAELRVRQELNALELARLKWSALGLPQDDLDGVRAGATATTPRLQIRSPIGGAVIHADLTVGKMVDAGEHLFEIVDHSTVLARIGVLEADLARLAPGLAVEVRLSAYPNETFRGAVAAVGRFLDPETHLNDVWVEFRNPDGDSAEPRLLPGMTGQARIALPKSAGTHTAPATALVNDGVDRFVLVEESRASASSEYRRKSVEVVRETSEVVEFRSSELFPGDRVATRGSHQLGAFFAPGALRLTPESARSIGLKVARVERRSVSTIVEAPGVVDLPPDRRGRSSARLAGAIASIKTERGRQVNADDVLAEVFSMEFLDMQLDLLRERLAAEAAEKQLAVMRSAAGAVPQRRLDEAESDLAVALGRCASLRRRLELVGLASRDIDALVERRAVVPALPVRADVAGTVVAFDRVVGQAVRADEPLFEIHDSARPWIQAFVSERELSRIQVGRRARIRVVGCPEVVLEGTAARSGRTFGAGNRTLSVWVELDRDPPQPLRHNQMARLAFVVEDHPAALAAPHAAVYREGAQAFVFVQDGDDFERREVRTGRADDRWVEIVGGLEEGEIVAVTAAAELHTAWASVR